MQPLLPFDLADSRIGNAELPGDGLLAHAQSVSSDGKPIARRVLGGGRAEQDGIDLAGDVSFQAAHGLSFRLALGSPPLDVGDRPFVEAHPAHHDHMQRDRVPNCGVRIFS